MPKMNFKTFILDFDEDNQTFTSFYVGESIIIEDVIDYLNYREDDDQTDVWLESTGSNADSRISPYLVFNSDLESSYKKGEEIEVTVRIVEGNLTGTEAFFFDIDDIEHVTVIKESEDKHGIDILGFHFEFRESLSFLDNNYGRFLVQFCIWVLIAIVVLLILDPIIHRTTKRTETKIDDIILDIIRRPILILIILYGIVVSLRELELPGEFMYWVDGAYGVGFYLMMIWIGYKIFQGVIIQIGHTMAKRTKYQVDKILVPAIQKIGTIVIGFVALGAILGYMQIDLTLFVAGGMVVSMVIAFAAQDTLSNFFSGIFLILEPKFKQGDMIMFEGDTYVVDKIGMRTTVLYDLFKHIDVVMPNNKLANEKLVNITEPDRRIKDSCSVGVAYGTDPQRVQNILMEIVSRHPDIINHDKDRKPFTRFSNFGDSSIDFKVGFWVKDLDDRFRVVSEVNQEIYYRLAKEGIEIPFPQRDLHMIEPSGNNIKPNNKVKKSIRKLKKK
jgi:small-conductance mechanosensitive channel